MRCHKEINKIFLCTVEPAGFSENVSLNEKTTHVRLTAPKSLLRKSLNLLYFSFMVNAIAKKNAIDLIWCKGAPAGGLGAFVRILSGVPFVVDSFEPHGDYMVDSGTWSRNSLKYRVQRWFESLGKRDALALLPVSYQYCQHLLAEGIAKEKLFVLPCVVDLDRFKFRPSARKSTRQMLQIDEGRTVGIYVGKYGGLYYNTEAFRLYQNLFKLFGDEFFLILLTETDPDLVRSQLIKHDLPLKNILVSRTKHSLIPDYLSAADFAISTIKAVCALRFCSPIKHGEYWSNDLPILSTLSAGDDAEIMRNEGGGVIIDALESRMQEIGKLKAHLSRRSTGFYANLASLHRGPLMLHQAIQFVVTSWLQMSNVEINEGK